MQDAAHHHHIVEAIRRQQSAGRSEHHTAARRNRLGAACHDRPLHVQGAAAVALIGGQAQVIDKDGEGGEREVMRQDHADAQRRAGFTLPGRNRIQAVVRH